MIVATGCNMTQVMHCNSTLTLFGYIYFYLLEETSVQYYILIFRDQRLWSTRNSITHFLVNTITQDCLIEEIINCPG